MKDRSSSVNSYYRELMVGANQYIFTCELQSGVFLLNDSFYLLSDEERCNASLTNLEWLYIATRVVPRIQLVPFFLRGGEFLLCLLKSGISSSGSCREMKYSISRRKGYEHFTRFREQRINQPSNG